MIAVDQNTGLTVYGVQALGCRLRRVLTTKVGGRVKRRKFGNRALSRLGKNQSPAEALIVQNLSIEALSSADNQVTDFIVSQCTAIPGENGFTVQITGEWQGQSLTVSVNL